MTIKGILPIALSVFVLTGCGAGSARDANEVQAPKMESRMGLSPQEKIDKIQSGNMSAADKAERIAKIKKDAGIK